MEKVNRTSLLALYREVENGLDLQYDQYREASAMAKLFNEPAVSC